MGSKFFFYFGVMGSSKSLRLLATAHDFTEKKIPIMVMKPSIDTRDGENKIKSRAGLEMPCISIGENDDLFKIIADENNRLLKENGEKLYWVFIDECQFLTEEQINQLSDVVDYLNINVSCYGLRTDFKSKLFPASKRLFEIADEFEEVKTRCECGRKSSINARIKSNGEIIKYGDQILVGGDDMYHAMCRKCWKQNKIKN